MANIKQQKKRILVAQRQRMENLRYRSTIKTLFKRLHTLVNESDKDGATSTHRELVQLLDRASARNVLHSNTAARKKSKAYRMLIAEPVKESKVVRRKKAAPARKPKAQKPDAETTAAAKTKAAAAKAPAKAAAAKAPAKAAATKAKAAKAEVAEAPATEADVAPEIVEEAAAPVAEAAPAEDAASTDADS